MNKLDLVKRIFRTQVKRYIPELSLTFLFIIITSLTTAATAWLLDPAIKEIFENKNIKMLYFIPLAIVLTFIIKAFSIYGTRIVTIKVGIKIIKNIQTLMAKKLILSDISHIKNLYYQISLILQKNILENTYQTLPMTLDCFLVF